MALGKKTKGLGRGFESLIPTDLVDEEFDPTSKEDAKVSQLVEIEIEKIVRDEDQPRKDFKPEALQELADSIKIHGVLQPIVVVKKGDKYQIVAGERRWRASKLAGLATIPSIVRTLDDQNRLELAIIENAQREDLNAIELATAYAKLKEQFNLRNVDIAKRVGKSSSSIINTLRLLQLPDEAKKAMREYNIGEGPMRPLVAQDHEMVLEVLPKMIEGNWSARKIEQYVAEHKKKSSSSAVKVNNYRKEEAELARKYDCEVRVRGRSVTLSAYDDEKFREVLAKLAQSD